jgi:hypothetical protein
MDESLADRFDLQTYVADEPVRVFRPDRYGPDDDEGVSIPERLWHRMRQIGAAYQLHLLPLLDGTTDPVFLNPAQVDQLLLELRFVGSIVDDPLLHGHVSSLVALAGLQSQGASKDSFGLDFP